jgi:hypothetical protein
MPQFPIASPAMRKTFSLLIIRTLIFTFSTNDYIELIITKNTNEVANN